MATVPVGGRSYDSAQTGFVNMASRNAGASAAAVQRPLYSPFEALQVNICCWTAVLLGHCNDLHSDVHAASVYHLTNLHSSIHCR